MTIDNDKLLSMRHGDSRWHAQRRRCEQFLNAATIRFRSHVNAARFEEADRAYTDILQTLDEMMQLAGVQR